MEKAKTGQVSADPKHDEMEKFATKLVSEWHDHLTKLKELAPSIKKVEEYFQKHVRGSVTLMDCSSFKEFCEKRLKRHRSVVYKMLQNYKRDAEGGQGEHERKNKGGSSGSKRDQLKQELTEAKANVERLLPVGQAAGKLANAVKEGNEALKEEAIKELLHTVSDPIVVKAMGTPVSHYVCVDVFSKALKKLTIAEQEPTLLEPERMLSGCQPFPWSRPVLEDARTVFNLVPCDNNFEREFAKFLNNAPDVTRFGKLPQPFGFAIDYTDGVMNLRSYGSRI